MIELRYTFQLVSTLKTLSSPEQTAARPSTLIDRAVNVPRGNAEKLSMHRAKGILDNNLTGVSPLLTIS